MKLRKRTNSHSFASFNAYSLCCHQEVITQLEDIFCVGGKEVVWVYREGVEEQRFKS